MVARTISDEGKADPVPVALSTQAVADEPIDDSRVTIFSLDGKEYTIPAKPRPGIGLRFVWEMKYRGETAAVANFLEAMLGVEGFAALVSFEDITQQQIKQVIEIAQKYAMGELETPKGG